MHIVNIMSSQPNNHLRSRRRGCFSRDRTYHRLESESLDLFDRLGSPLLEGHAVELGLLSATSFQSLEGGHNYPLVKVNGVLASHDISDGRALGLARGLLSCSLGRHSVEGKQVVSCVPSLGIGGLRG